MATKIQFVHEGKDYTLEFSRDTVRRMEANGFKPQEILDKPNLSLPALFAGAFMKNHKHLKEDVIKEIMRKITDKDTLFETLIRMYNEPLEALMEEPDDDEGNVTWEVRK